MSEQPFSKLWPQIQLNGLKLKDASITSPDDAEEYTKLCYAAIIENGMALMYVKTSYISISDYEIMCWYAIRTSPSAFKFIISSKLPQGVYLEMCRFVYSRGVRHKVIKPVWRPILPDPDTKENPRCGITLDEIGDADEYYMCSRNHLHIFNRKSMDQWVKSCQSKKYLCVLCVDAPLMPTIYINGD